MNKFEGSISQADKPEEPQWDHTSTSEHFEGQGKPEISFEIAYGAHGEKNDTSQLEEMVKGADVFIMEGYGWTDKSERKINHMSRGGVVGTAIYLDNSAGQRGRQALNKISGGRVGEMAGFKRKILDTVYSSNKAIAFVDVKKGSNLHKESRGDMLPRERKAERILRKQDSFEDAVQTFDQMAQEFADHQKQREEHMIDNINPVLEELFKKNPELASKKDLKVAMFLGAAHTGVHHRLKERGESVDRSFERESTYTYPHTTTLTRSYMFDKQPTAELQKKAFTQYIIKRHTERPVKPTDTYETSRSLNVLVDSLDESEYEEVWRQWKDDPAALRVSLSERQKKLQEKK